jgi:hypothetical protein
MQNAIARNFPTGEHTYKARTPLSADVRPGAGWASATVLPPHVRADGAAGSRGVPPGLGDLALFP